MSVPRFEGPTPRDNLMFDLGEGRHCFQKMSLLQLAWAPRPLNGSGKSNIFRVGLKHI